MKYELFSILSLLARFGGLFSVILIIARGIGEQINYQNVISKVIRDLYFVNTDDLNEVRRKTKSRNSMVNFEGTELPTHKTIKLKFWDRFCFLKRLFHKSTTALESYMTPSQITFIKG